MIRNVVCILLVACDDCVHCAENLTKNKEKEPLLTLIEDMEILKGLQGMVVQVNMHCSAGSCRCVSVRLVWYGRVMNKE